MNIKCGDIEITLDYICRDMRRAANISRASLYVQKAREWAWSLEHYGVRRLPEILRELRFFTGKPQTTGMSFGGKGNSVPVPYSLSTQHPEVHRIDKSRSRTINLGTETTARQCFLDWLGWLGMVTMGVPRPKKEATKNLYADNFESVFTKEPEAEKAA